MLTSECANAAQRTKSTKASTAAQAIVIARKRFPDLSGDGIRPFPSAAPQEIHECQVETAMVFLKLLRPTRRPTIDSGALKHDAENWGSVNGLCPYVSRGALTAAAIGLGLVVRPYRFGPHVAIGVSITDLRAVNAETLELRIERRARRGQIEI
jgi:hypothetical protein